MKRSLFILLMAGWGAVAVRPVGAAGFDNLLPKPRPKTAPAQEAPKASPKTEAPAPPPAASNSPPTPAAAPTPTPVPASATGPAAEASTAVKEPAKPVAKPAPAPRGAVAIQSDGGFEYDGETGRVVYRKNVLVEDPANDPRTTIACEWLTTILPPPGEKIGEIIALTNVVITIKDTKGLQIVKGARAVYNATNDIVVITGNPIVEMPSGILLGDERIIYSRATEKFEAPGKIRMIARPEGQAAVSDLLRGTNAPKSSPTSTTTNKPPTKP